MYFKFYTSLILLRLSSTRFISFIGLIEHIINENLFGFELNAFEHLKFQLKTEIAWILFESFAWIVIF